MKDASGDENASVRVLMVDDDQDYRALCQRFLRRHPGTQFELEGADTGAVALERCLGSRYDCLLIDYRLPDATGTEVIGMLRDALGEHLPPAIILTALGGEAAATEAVRAGASDFLAKRDVSRESLSRALVNAAEKGRLRAMNIQRRDELAAACEELRRSNDEIQRFYHTVSHEVKTPLTAIREFLSIMRDDIAGPTTEEQQEVLGYALESCDQLVGQFNDLVTLTRLQTGKLEISPEWTTLESVVTRCLTAARVAAGQKSITLRNALPDGLPPVWIDANRIAQVLANLLNNAIKFTGEGGDVTLIVMDGADADTLEIGVRDSGPGIDPEHLEKIFDRLYQVTPNMRGPNEGGLGLGLSIAQEIVSRHGNRLKVASVVGEGSIFSFTLRCALEPVSTPCGASPEGSCTGTPDAVIDSATSRASMDTTAVAANDDTIKTCDFAPTDTGAETTMRARASTATGQHGR